MPEEIMNEVMLNHLMEDVAFYTSKNDITNNLDNSSR